MNVVARRMFVPVVVAIVFALAVAVPSARSLFAQENNRAVKINGRTCSLADGDGNFLTTEDSRTVITSSGNSIFTCSVQGVPNSTGHAVHYDFSSTGEVCHVYESGSTEKWHETVSASGNAKLVCIVSNK